MRPLPAGWPAPSDDAINDDVMVSAPGATWIPGPQVVDTFTVKRELVGSLLPGQIRSGSGLSVTSGDCTFTYRAEDGAPWRQGPGRVKPSGTAVLYAAAGAASIPLGSFTIDDVSAKLSTPTMVLGLVDEKLSSRQPNRLFGRTDSSGIVSADAAWTVDKMARELGFYSTPKPVASCVLSVPMSGSDDSEVPSRYHKTVASYPDGWDTRFGTISPVGSVITTLSASWYMAAFCPYSSFFVTFTATGLVSLRPMVDAAAFDCPAILVEDGYLGLVNNLLTAVTVTEGTYVPGDDPIHPNRVEIECQRLGVAGAWTAFRARARSSATSAWGAWVTDSLPSTEPEAEFGIGDVTAQVSMIGLQVTSAQDDGVWDPPTATIHPLGNKLLVVSLPPAQDPWAAIQDVVASNMGVAFVDADNHLLVRDFKWLRGQRPIDAALEVLDDLDDLDWTMATEDQADRVEVTYRPPDIGRSTTTTDPEMWKADQVYEIPGGGTLALVIDRKMAGLVWNWYPEWDTGVGPVGRYSRWNARPNRDGTGSQPDKDELEFSLRAVNSTRGILNITNNKNTKLFTVNASGEPALTLRGDYVSTQENDVLVASGVSADVAVNPLAIALGNYCQTDADARRVLAFATSQTRYPSFRVGAVTVPFDWRREIGDLYTLTHEGVSLDVKVLVTGISIQGEPGKNTQQLDLVVIDKSIWDFNQLWAQLGTAATIGSFNTLWAGKTFADFNAAPLGRPFVRHYDDVPPGTTYAAAAVAYPTYFDALTTP